MPFLLAGLGTALPEHSIEQSDSAAVVEPLCCDTDDQRRLLNALYRRTGVARRHSVLLEASTGDLAQRQQFFHRRTSGHDPGPSTAERMRRYVAEASPLAERAVRAALDDAGLSANQVTHLVTVSCSGFAAPGWDISLIGKLLIPAGVARTHVGFMGCHGALNGLRVAKAFADADPKAVVVIVALELCSLHHQYGWDPEQIVSNAIFADGAAAVIGVGSSAIRNNETKRWTLQQSGSHLVPDTTDVMTWTIGDHGFEMTLSPRVPDLIHQFLRPWIEPWLRSNGLMLEEIQHWAIHPGGPRIVSAAGEALSLPATALEPSRSVLRDYGNMSSPTILFLLERLRKETCTGPCVAIGFGPGLTIEAASFTTVHRDSP